MPAALRPRRVCTPWGVALWLAVVSTLATGCAQTVVRPTTPHGPCSGGNCAAGPGVRDVRLLVEPDDGEAPILSALRGATTSIWAEVYLLTSRSVIHALEDAATRGVEVRVLLEPHPYGQGEIGARRVSEELMAAGVRVRDANPAYYFTHSKVLLIDAATVYILTGNLSRSALGGSSATANREYGIIDTHPAEVAEVAAILRADWERLPTPTLTNPNLVVSPINARSKLFDLIATARSSLRIEDEELYDALSVAALVAAARRGVQVEVLVPPPRAGSYEAQVRQLVAGGVAVRLLTAPFLHAKLLLVDGTRAFLGSENFSSTSLDQNREIGVIVADASALERLARTFGQDWAVGRAA